MSEAKFTKGDWSVEIGCSQAFVATDNKFIHECNVDIALGNREERVANAYLIAVAPKMYEHLIGIKSYLEQFCGETPNQRLVMESIDKLLAEARGESV